jgi:hypothetical protein
MKRKHTFILCVVLLMHGTLCAQEPPVGVSQSRVNKPLLFATLPDQFECNYNELQKIVSAESNAEISAQLSGQFSIKGVVSEKNHSNPGTLSVNIRLQNYHNALFNISLRLLADNSINIQGRILHPKYDDVLVLYQDKGRYYFKKKSQRLFMPE